jgi:hypothetical protein
LPGQNISQRSDLAEVSSNVTQAYAYPSISVKGLTDNGNELRLNSDIISNRSRTGMGLPSTSTKIQNLDSERIKEKLKVAPPVG